MSRKDDPISSAKTDLKAPAKPAVKKEPEPKGKKKLFSEDPIIDNSEDEELDEDEFKRRKACEAEMDEHQRIIREAEETRKLRRKLKLLFKEKSFYFLSGL